MNIFFTDHTVVIQNQRTGLITYIRVFKKGEIWNTMLSGPLYAAEFI